MCSMCVPMPCSSSPPLVVRSSVWLVPGVVPLLLVSLISASMPLSTQTVASSYLEYLSGIL
jgi:hypothetical protein